MVADQQNKVFSVVLSSCKAVTNNVQNEETEGEARKTKGILVMSGVE